MRKPFFSLSIFDEALNKIAQKYGGWPRLLDPSQPTPDEFILELEKAGYTEDGFESIKSRIGKPEREYWITLIAYIVKNKQSGDKKEWHDRMLDEFLPKMREHNISDSEIKAAMEKAVLDRSTNCY